MMSKRREKVLRYIIQSGTRSVIMFLPTQYDDDDDDVLISSSIIN